MGSLDDVQVLLSERVSKNGNNQAAQASNYRKLFRPGSTIQQADEFFNDADEAKDEYGEDVDDQDEDIHEDDRMVQGRKL